MSERNLKIYEASIPLIALGLKSLLILAVFLYLRKPITEITNLLPAKIAGACTIKFQDFQVVSNECKNPSEEVVEVIKQVPLASVNPLEELAEAETPLSVSTFSEADIENLVELERVGLIEASGSLDDQETTLAVNQIGIDAIEAINIAGLSNASP